VTADIAVVEINQETAREFVLQAEPPTRFVPAKLFGLVPVTLSNDLRIALRAHFRLLVSKPVHHDAFFALLAGSWGSVPTLQPPTHFGFRVLVVEKNPLNQRLVHRVLASLGCSTAMVDNGSRAVALLAERTADFDLVILDLNLPESDGSSALREIRAGRAGPVAQTIWIIALTADPREEPRSRGMAEGLNDYLTKPLKLSDLEAALKKFRAHRAALKH
jgi:CheY-like chemotaxis protein